jgi:hypothetical protein
MIKKRILNPQRVRSIEGGFSFIPHRFLTGGFLQALPQKSLLLYLFLVLVSDRNGLSFYAYDSICSLLQFGLDDYIEARDELIASDLIAFDGDCFQVLKLPPKPVRRTRQQDSPRNHEIARLIRQSLKEAPDDRQEDNF